MMKVIPNTAYDALRDAFFALCSSKSLVGVCGHENDGKSFFDHTECYVLTKSEINEFPDITFKLSDSVTVNIPPSQYLVQSRCRLYYFYFLAIDPMPDGSGSILGNVFMQGYSIAFDKGNRRVGFAPVANCRLLFQNIAFQLFTISI